MTQAAAGAEFEMRLKAVAGAIETLLGRLLEPAPLPGEIARPARLLEAVRYSSLGGGKRLRPFLLDRDRAAVRRGRRGRRARRRRGRNDPLLFARA